MTFFKFTFFKKAPLKNENGAVLLDFIFALVLVLSMTFVLGTFSFSLSVVESLQYLTYSSSRSYFAAHINEQKQHEAAEKKFNELSQEKTYKALLKKDWFEFTIDRIGDSSDTYGATTSKDIFKGVRAKLVVNLLNLNLPLFGSTEGDSPYITYINSFLGREPTSEECLLVIQERFKRILQLDGTYSASSIDPKNYIGIADNGC